MNPPFALRAHVPWSAGFQTSLAPHNTTRANRTFKLQTTMKSSPFPHPRDSRNPRLLCFFALFALLCGNAFGQSSPKLLPFQGRLTDQNGVAVSNGVRLVQFKIYDVPTGGSPVWAGELHRTTVNGGLVNVMLGTKTPLSGVDFDKQLYLEITVDVSGPAGTPDNSITAADPPMLPRQAILPVVFAKEAADSRLLAGSSWIPLFGTNSPNGPLLPTKIATNSILGSQIADQTITASQIASNTITARQMTAGSISTRELNGAVATLPGTITAFGGVSVPPNSGWLLCDGQAVSSQQYPQLFAAISTAWGTGVQGSTNDFNLPDVRGLFLRGVDLTGANDPDYQSRTNRSGVQSANVGSIQQDALKSHVHRMMGIFFNGYGGGGGGGFGGSGSTPTYANDDGRNETRPKNAYVNYIIKY